MANDTVTIEQLPLAVSLNGTEQVPISVPGAGGTYVTSRTTTAAIATVAVDAEYVLVGQSPKIPNGRTLTGTAGDITVTDNGPGSTIVLDLGPTTGTGNIVRASGATIGNVGITGAEITGLPTPVNPSDAATKAYVDTVAAGLSPRVSCQVATVTTLPANTYANGSAGVGATLTATGNGALTIDGYAPALNDRVLVQNEGAGAHNGIYSLTTVGTASVPYVLTRTLDYDTSALIFAGTFTLILNGTVNAEKSFALVTSGTVTVGTTALVFSQINTGTTYSAGNGLTLTSTIFSIDTSITVDKTTAQTLSNKTLVAPALGTPASGVATHLTGLPPDTGLVDGTADLPLVANGGAGPSYRSLPIAGGGTQTPTGSLSIVTAAGPFTITTEDWLVLNKGSASATIINLPTVASRAGRALRITDWAGNAGDITLTPNGAEIIMGLSSAVLGSSGQGLGTAANITLNPSADLSGWLVS